MIRAKIAIRRSAVSAEFAAMVNGHPPELRMRPGSSSDPFGPFTSGQVDATISANTRMRATMNMKPFRILLAAMPAMLMEMIVQIIAREPEFVIVGEFVECPDLTSAMRHSRADLLIVGESSLAGGDVATVLSSNYPTKIIIIAEDGHCATLNELRPHRETLVDVSAARLIAAIRTAIAPAEFTPTLQ